jgi:UDP-N-acetylglucosamine 4,6-dehydratase/5-epimerase
MKLDYLKNKKVLVTGGTGSIGSALVFKLIKTNCKVIRVMSNDENGLYELSKKVSQFFTINYNIFFNLMGKNRIRFFLGDVRDKKRCLEVTKDVDVVIHAAAIKHVNISEYNPNEAIQTNFIGTKNMLKAAQKNKVSKFLFISTDKVVDPINIMGKSKLLAEKFATGFNSKKISVSSIRFGNVIGSRGSVVPKFIDLLKNNKNIIVTSDKMARFVMSIQETVESALSVIAHMKGGEIFILKSMKCFRIIDLAQALKNYFKSKSKIIISNIIDNEKFSEELFSKKEIPYISINKKLFVIKDKKNHRNVLKYKYFNKYRKSNFNFLNKKEIISLLKKSKII